MMLERKQAPRAHPARWIAVLGLLAASPLAGQGPTAMPEVRVLTRSTTEAADSLFDAFAPGLALELLEGHLQGRPDDAEARWRAARAGLVAGILAADPDRKAALIARAAEHGEAAVALRPDGLDELYWAAAAAGREALRHGPRTSTRLVQRVWDLTRHLLALAPDHPGGHNILGKLNHEVMALSGFERFVGRLLFRIDPLREASWEDALQHHEAAVAADPGVVLFRMDLGATYEALGRDVEARAQYEAALALPPAFPVDPRFQDDIRRRLAALPEALSPGDLSPTGR